MATKNIIRRTARNKLSLVVRKKIMYDFSLLERHRKEVKTWLVRASRDAEENWKRLSESLPEEAVNVLVDITYETQELLPRVQWNAQLIVAYSTFEYALNQICQHGKTRVKSRLGMSDLSGNGIERAKNYLSKVIGIDGPFAIDAWSEVRDIGTLRNVIVHSNGEFDDPPTQQQLAAISAIGKRGWKEVHIVRKDEDDPKSDPQYVRLTGTFVNHAIHVMSEVIESMFAATIPDELLPPLTPKATSAQT